MYSLREEGDSEGSGPKNLSQKALDLPFGVTEESKEVSILFSLSSVKV